MIGALLCGALTTSANALPAARGPAAKRTPGRTISAAAQPRATLENQRPYKRQMVQTPKDLRNLLHNGQNTPFVKEVIGKARTAVKRQSRFQGHGITRVSKGQTHGTFNVQVTLFQALPNAGASTLRVQVPVVRPNCFSRSDLRAAFGTPTVLP